MSDVLKQTKAALDRMVDDARRRKNEEDRKFLVSSIGKDLAESLAPVLQSVVNNNQSFKEEIREAVSGIQINVPKGEIDVKIPQITVPAPQVTVNVPDVIIPEIKLPIINVPE